MKEFNLTDDEYHALTQAHRNLRHAQIELRAALDNIKSGHPEFKTTQQYTLYGTRKLTQEDNE